MVAGIFSRVLPDRFYYSMKESITVCHKSRTRHDRMQLYGSQETIELFVLFLVSSPAAGPDEIGPCIGPGFSGRQPFAGMQEKVFS